MDDSTALLRRLWKDPETMDYYLGAYIVNDRPEYLINLSVLLKYLANETDAVRLVLSAQRVIVAYLQELHNETGQPTGLLENIDRSIDCVAAFADVLDNAICRDGGMIDKYMKREINPLTETKWQQ